MRAYELLFGAVSIISFILAFKIEDKVYQMGAISAGFFILIVFYISSKMENIKGIAESSSSEIKKLNEKVKIYERLTDLDLRIKKLEKGGIKR